MSERGRKMILILRFLLVSFLLLPLPTQKMRAQEMASAAQQPASEVEFLRLQIQEQQTQIEQLQQSLKQQSDLLQQQQQLLEALRQKLEPAGGAPAATTAGSSIIEAKAAAPKPSDQPTPKATEGPILGKIKFHGLLQGWFAGGDGGFRDTFRLRRGELKLSGEITPKAKWTVMIDPAKAISVNNTWDTIGGTKVVSDVKVSQASRILQDAFLTLDYIPRVHLDFGQFKVPLSLEGLQSSATLETVERAMFASDRTRGGTYGDIRDLGVMLRGPITSHLDYQIGLFNGSGETQNDMDKNDQKALIGRLVVRPPFLKGLQIGGSGAWGNGQRADRPRRDRLGAELLYNRRSLLLKSEFMTGKDSSTSRLGYYGLIGYKVRPNVQAVFRFDVWDPDTRLETDSSNVTERDYVVGVNYFITESTLKLQLNYVRKTFQNQLLPSKNLALVNLQTSW